MLWEGADPEAEEAEEEITHENTDEQKLKELGKRLGVATSDEEEHEVVASALPDEKVRKSSPDQQSTADSGAPAPQSTEERGGSPVDWWPLLKVRVKYFTQTQGMPVKKRKCC